MDHAWISNLYIKYIKKKLFVYTISVYTRHGACVKDQSDELNTCMKRHQTQIETLPAKGTGYSTEDDEAAFVERICK